jgi:uncharacterized protein (TIGR02147 family)
MQYVRHYHREKLRSELNQRSQVNPHYSLRAFARDLGVTPSWLSEFLNGKKGLSVAQARKIVQRLDLSDNEAEVFLLSVRATHARDHRERLSAQAEVRQRLDERRDVKFVNLEIQRTVNSWYHLALLELTELEGFKSSPSWIARRLRLPLVLVKRALADLERAGLLARVNGVYRATSAETETTYDIPSEDIRQFHVQMLDRAKQALFDQSVFEREFSSMTFSFDMQDLPRAKTFLRQLARQFIEEFYRPLAKKNSIYQMSLQLFRLDDPKGEKK